MPMYGDWYSPAPMKILQHNCGRTYTNVQIALEHARQEGADIVCLQEPCVYSQRPLDHPGFALHYPNGRQQDWRVAIAIRRGTRLVVEMRTDLVNHDEIMAADVWETEGRAKIRKTRIVNVYDQWRTVNGTRRRNLSDIQWERVIEDRRVSLGDCKSDSPLLK